MGKQTAIQWTNSTWNPWRGCKKVSSGCKNCYMYRDMKRYGRNPEVTVRAAPATFKSPLHWKKPAFVFTCSWSDFFIDSANAWRGDAWDIIRQTPHLTYQILTKRADRIAAYLPADWGSGWPNVWLGVSVESPNYYWRLDALAKVPAVIRFVSYEPALAAVSFSPWLSAASLDWVISGGESVGRPAAVAWFRAVRDETVGAGVAYFHKQHGGNRKYDGAWGGRLLDDVYWNEMPESTAEPVMKQVRLI